MRDTISLILSLLVAGGIGLSLLNPATAQHSPGVDASRYILFEDDMESDAFVWSSDYQGPEGEDFYFWERTTTSSHSGTYARTDSPDGNYQNNRVVTLSSPPIDLTGVSSATLTFWEKFDFASGDESVVYMYLGNREWVDIRRFVGKNSTPWRQVSFDLSPFVGRSIELNFRVNSDATGTADGWYIDDVVVFSSDFAPLAPNPDYCRDYGPCSAGQGDCDPGQCAAGLVCTNDVGTQYSLPAHYDVCEQPQRSGTGSDNLFEDDMENGVNGWSGWDWGRTLLSWVQTTTTSHSGTHAWTTEREGFLASPVIDLTGVTQATLTFWHRSDFGSTDGAIAWTRKGASSSYQYLGAVAGVDLGDTLDDINPSWTRVSIDLSPLVGQEIVLLFHLWDKTRTGDAWYIDDVAVSSSDFDTVPDPDYCQDYGPCSAGQGDCDPGQCAAGLVCVNDVGAQYGLPAHYDVCEVTSGGTSGVRTGLVALKSGNMRDANNAFRQATRDDPTDTTAGLYHAITRIATKAVDSPQLRELARRSGVSLGSDASDVCLVDFPLPEDILSGAPQTAEIFNALRDVLVPEIDAALTTLNGLPTSIEVPFVLGNLPSCLSMLTNDFAVEIDRSDVQILTATLQAIRGMLEFLAAYDVDVGLQALKTPTLQEILAAEPTTFPLVSSTRLSSARTFFNRALESASQAISLVLAETDSQEDDVLVITPGDVADAQRTKRILDLVRQSLGETVVLPTDIGLDDPERLNLNILFSGRIGALRPLLLAPGGTFSDPTFGGIAPDFTQQDIEAYTPENFLTWLGGE